MVLILYGLDLVELIIVRGDGAWTFVRWNRDYALFAFDDEVTRVPPVCAIKPVFQLLIKR